MYDFTFKGINSRDLGITVNRRPPRESANTRSTITEIDGVDGGYIEKVGLNTYVMEFDMTVEGLHNVEKITGWLQGQGEFRRSDVPGKALWVEHQAPLEFEYLTDDLYTCTTTFYVVDPTWYLVEDAWDEPWGANLIPNGWDSFQPYGSGKNYVENWDFSTDDLSEYKTYGVGLNIENNILTAYSPNNQPASSIFFNNIAYIGKILVRVKMKTPNGSRIYGHTGTNKSRMNIEPSNIFKIYELEVELLENINQIYIYTVQNAGGLAGSRIEIDWIQITPVDNQHLVVAKTPLENGLTRIQTWGGKNVIKLVLTLRATQDEKHSFSCYFENKSNKFFMTRNNPFIKEEIKVGETKYTQFSGTAAHTANINHHIIADKLSDNLDFIASDPQIVEGDKSPTWKADSNPRIVNEGNYKSLPIIKLEYGTSKYVDVLVNKTRFVYEFKDNDKFVIIDCENQTAVDEQGRNRIRNLKIGYEFPTLRPGPNTVKIIDGDAKITFRRKDRWR